MYDSVAGQFATQVLTRDFWLSVGAAYCGTIVRLSICWALDSLAKTTEISWNSSYARKSHADMHPQMH